MVNSHFGCKPAAKGGSDGQDLLQTQFLHEIYIVKDQVFDVVNSLETV
jgi:hypothetical protein